MLKSITFKIDFQRGDGKVLFKAGEKIKFSPGINLLVGDQGTGKSSLIWLIRSFANRKNTKKYYPCKEPEKIANLNTSPCNIFSFDFEKENPRDSRGRIDDIAEIYSKWISHGEMNLALLKQIPGLDSTDIYVLDEPDSALCIRSIRKLYNILKTKSQVIASAHNPLLIKLVERDVYDMEDHTWKSFAHFEKSQEDISKEDLTPKQ